SDKWELLIAAVAAAALIIPGGRTAVSMYRGALRATAGALRHEKLVSTAVVLRHRRLQEAVPPGAAILARLDRPFVLDFRRNPVLIIDFPGGASLAPGLPFFQGGEAVARYLTSQGIRWGGGLGASFSISGCKNTGRTSSATAMLARSTLTSISPASVSFRSR